MKGLEAENQLCKMQAEIAARLGLETCCTCSRSTPETDTREVPNEVIEEMWRRLTHPCWSAENHPVSMELMTQCSLKDIHEITDEEWAEALKQAAEKDSNDLQRLEEGPAQQRDRTLMSKETFDMLVQPWAVPDEEK